MPRANKLSTFNKRAQELLVGPQLLAFLPALCLGAYWLIGEGGLVACALGLPVIWATFVGFDAKAAPSDNVAAQTLGTLANGLSHMLGSAKPTDRIAVFAIAIDDAPEIAKHISKADLQQIQDGLELRYATSLRATDLIERTGTLTWIIALTPGANLDLEAAIQQASRLQTIVDEPFFIGNDRLYFTSCIGFTLVQLPVENSENLVQQPRDALHEAVLNGPDAIRAYSGLSPSKTASPNPLSVTELNGDLETCLSAWFQPQISTDTGQVCGFEALARWHDAKGHWLSPGVFLPILEQSGQMERLTELMLAQSLSALAQWDKAGLEVETVGVNFSETDLANPRIYEKVAWDLDRFDISPHRLCIEVLESVIAGDSDDMIVRNVTQLAELGCQIDLDDFGTGHASISTLRRLPVRRLKIDRSFVAKADLDSEQQKMVATILMMADRLGLTCLAEGVETLGEHTILAQLGCRYVQGFGIAKPMPMEETVAWTQDYQARRVCMPQIGRKTS
jgi:EAL domain-containing protein (putative c-di-GMP-specific phosphodiesterase class I)